MFNKPVGTEEKRRANDRMNGLLDKGCSFEGKLTFDGSVQINGDFKGEIYSDGTLIIGDTANVHAKIYVDSVVIYGKFEGEIEAKSRIDLHLPATVIGNIKTRSISLQDGVIFQGHCEMDRAEVTPFDHISIPTGIDGVVEGELELGDTIEDDVLVM